MADRSRVPVRNGPEGRRLPPGRCPEGLDLLADGARPVEVPPAPDALHQG